MNLERGIYSLRPASSVYPFLFSFIYQSHVKSRMFFHRIFLGKLARQSRQR
jgi:hypothetical protein